MTTLKMDFENTNPFEGDFPIWVRSLPAGTRIKKAQIALQPREAPENGTLRQFEHEIVFTADQTFALLTRTPSSIEVAFGNRLTMVAIAGSNIGGAVVQVDVGSGVYMALNPQSTFAGPDEAPFTLGAPSNEVGQSWYALPPIEVTRFRLISNSRTEVNEVRNISEVQAVRVRSIPANINVSLGDLAPFWTHVGPLKNRQKSPDFTAILNNFLAEAPIENGHYAFPLIVNSPMITCLQIEATIDYIVEKQLLPVDLPEFVLPYRFSGVAATQDQLQILRLTRSAIVRSGRAVVQGSFEDSRIAFGALFIDQKNTLPVEISPQCSLAAPLLSTEELHITSVDLLLSNQQPGSTNLHVDIQSDTDGKPSGEILVRATLEVANISGGKAEWFNALLSGDFQVFANQRYWLVLQSNNQTIFWCASPLQNGAVPLQCTRNNGLSWRAAVDVDETLSTLIAHFRLRFTPSSFTMPVRLLVGEGDESVTETFEKMEPLGRLDLNIDLAKPVRQFLNRKRAVTPAEDVNLIINGEFTDHPGFAAGDATLFGAPRSWEPVPEMQNMIGDRLGLINWDSRIEGIREAGSGKRVAAYLRADDAVTLAGIQQKVPIIPESTYELVFFYQTDFREPGPSPLVIGAALTAEQKENGQVNQGTAIGRVAFGALEQVPLAVDNFHTDEANAANIDNIDNENSPKPLKFKTEAILEFEPAVYGAALTLTLAEAATILAVFDDGSSQFHFGDFDVIDLHSDNPDEAKLDRVYIRNPQFSTVEFEDAPDSLHDLQLDEITVRRTKTKHYDIDDFVPSEANGALVPDETGFQLIHTGDQNQQTRMKITKGFRTLNVSVQDPPSFILEKVEDRFILPITGQPEKVAQVELVLPQSPRLRLSANSIQLTFLTDEPQSQPQVLLFNADGEPVPIGNYFAEEQSFADSQLTSVGAKAQIWTVEAASGEFNRIIVRSTAQIVNGIYGLHDLSYCLQLGCGQAEFIRDCVEKALDFEEFKLEFPEFPKGEIVWLDQADNKIGTDPIIIEQGAREVNDFDGLFRVNQSVTAPEDAKAAYVRFLQPPRGMFFIDSVSFKASRELLQNNRFQNWQRAPDSEHELPVNWIATSAAAEHIRPYQPEGLIQGAALMGSRSTFDLTLSQTIKVKTQREYEFFLRGCSHSQAVGDDEGIDPETRPRVVLMWRTQQGQTIGDPETLFLDWRGIHLHSWRGVAPENADRIEVEIIQPGLAATNEPAVELSTMQAGDFVLQWVALHLIGDIDVPLRFLGEAPGELVLTELNLGFETPVEVLDFQDERLLLQPEAAEELEIRQVENEIVSAFTITPSEINFAAGQSSKEISVTLNGDRSVPADAINFTWTIIEPLPDEIAIAIAPETEKQSTATVTTDKENDAIPNESDVIEENVQIQLTVSLKEDTHTTNNSQQILRIFIWRVAPQIDVAGPLAPFAWRDNHIIDVAPGSAISFGVDGSQSKPSARIADFIWELLQIKAGEADEIIENAVTPSQDSQTAGQATISFNAPAANETATVNYEARLTLQDAAADEIGSHTNIDQIHAFSLNVKKLEAIITSLQYVNPAGNRVDLPMPTTLRPGETIQLHVITSASKPAVPDYLIGTRTLEFSVRQGAGETETVISETTSDLAAPDTKLSLTVPDNPGVYNLITTLTITGIRSTILDTTENKISNAITVVLLVAEFTIAPTAITLILNQTGSVSVTANNSTPRANDVSYRWSLNAVHQGGQDNQDNPTFTIGPFSVPGNFEVNVRLDVHDDRGHSESVEQNVSVVVGSPPIIIGGTLTAESAEAAPVEPFMVDTSVTFIKGLGAARAEALANLPQPVLTIGELAVLPPDTTIAGIPNEVLIQTIEAARSLLQVTIPPEIFTALSGMTPAAVIEEPAADLAGRTTQPEEAIRELQNDLRVVQDFVTVTTFRSVTLGELGSR